MGRMGRFQASDLEKFCSELQKLEGNINEFLEQCTKELAARLLRLVIKRTPVGEYPQSSGKKGGTLRRGWTVGQSPSSTNGVTGSMTVRHFGDTYIIEIQNPVEYAVYVEYGHRTPNKKGWVRGEFMMTISERELERMAPEILEKKIRRFLGGIFR